MNRKLVKFSKKKNFIKADTKTKITDIFSILVKKNNNTAFIFNSKNILKGVLTLGDFRQAAKSNIDLNSDVGKIINRNLKFCKVGDSKEKIENIFMLNPLLLDLPVLDKNKKVKFIYSRKLVDNNKNNLKNCSAVIMAGGHGKRLRPFTYMIPKPLIPFNNKTLIQEIIDKFISYKIKNIFIISNYKKNILKSFLKIRYKSLNFFEEPSFLGTFGGVKYLEKKLTDSFILANCDTLQNFNYLESMNFHKKMKNDITVISSYKSEKSKYGICKFDKKNKLIELKEKPLTYSHINTGMYIIQKNVLKKIKKNQKTDITEFIKKNIKILKCGVFQIHDKQFRDFGTIKDYLNLE